ncbi:hypothetical protein DSM106972_028350 [Dulcicalothrix desertica PCC 7102]|uniref:DUF4258 domain-containing protein n=1 Tax=Dulcicalothrix desertica PCC 7102 TaxID=232991 RepID=A0A3S1APZ6_9CYAN|nr:DUF4258 domain-containing protein [Dulcicalothrix desertica]RUT06578.1 hypothetical protein DSM106972_028350 [Dulcicalothrix desertica PCC 7102]
MIKLIEEIRQKIANNKFELSKHALDKSTKRRISINEIRETVASGLVIEDYRDDNRTYAKKPGFYAKSSFLLQVIDKETRFLGFLHKS